MTEDSTIVQAAEGGDGLRRWRLLRRQHGLYVYEEMTLENEIYHVDEDGDEGAVVADAHWVPTHVSGLFDSSAAARADAIATLPWLRRALPTEATHGR